MITQLLKWIKRICSQDAIVAHLNVNSFYICNAAEKILCITSKWQKHRLKTNSFLPYCNQLHWQRDKQQSICCPQLRLPGEKKKEGERERGCGSQSLCDSPRALWYVLSLEQTEAAGSKSTSASTNLFDQILLFIESFIRKLTLSAVGT